MSESGKSSRLADKLSCLKCGVRYGKPDPKARPELRPDERDLIVRALRRHSALSIDDESSASTCEETRDMSALAKLEGICAEIYSQWDKDMRSGKLLSALAGGIPRYRQDVTDVREALAEIERLRATEARLRAALEPFAEAANVHEAREAQIAATVPLEPRLEDECDIGMHQEIRFGDCKRARAALADA